MHTSHRIPPRPRVSTRRRVTMIAATLGLAAVLTLGTATGIATGDDTTELSLRPNGTDIVATLSVDGRNVAGTATGLDPERRYISLYYGSMSTPQPGQLLTCADARTAALPRAWGIAGEWVVDDDGTGTLDGTAPRDLDDGVYTASIRLVPVTAGSDPYDLFDPVRYPVQACGVVPGGPRLPVPSVPSPLGQLPVTVGF